MADSEYLHTFTDDSYQEDVLDADKPVLIDFWAAWCGPCRQIAPIVEELAEEYDGRVKVGKMDIDDNPKTPQSYGIRSIPTLLIVKDGEPVDQIVGVAPKSQLKSKLDKHLATAA